ncbi:Sphingosine N-acyltransferase lac1 [Mycena venus]|uniref:Sphingosine N-acyltransferase lac1 n=1 Tax=Mycena venus TaxID=2733690 RepID=A0A8H6YT75_9AGAR|nr:Sphingosine N-acyltransferase lac1 [Mycena venus]
MPKFNSPSASDDIDCPPKTKDKDRVCEPRLSYSDPSHLATPDSPPTPLTPVTAPTPSSIPCSKPSMSPSPSTKPEGASPWLRWVISPTSAARFLVLPSLLALPMHYLLPYLRPFIPSRLQPTGNLFTPLGRCTSKGSATSSSWRTPLSSSPSYGSCSRTTRFSHLFGTMASATGQAGGVRRAETAYWSQQFFVLILGPEKRRSDQWELVIHHVITVWMVSWSYLMHLTLLGNAVFVSMGVPDVLLTQFLVHILGLEKKRSDYGELSIHHIIMMWMVSWSYLMPVTLLGNAVFVSMHVPDVLLAV